MSARVVKQVEITSRRWYEGSDGVNQTFRDVISAAEKELVANPASVVLGFSGETPAKMVIKRTRVEQSVTLRFTTEERVSR